MSTDGHLPEAAADAEPARTTSGLPPNTPDGTDATADSAGGPVDTGTVEGDAAAGNIDPDLVADADLDAQDPA